MAPDPKRLVQTGISLEAGHLDDLKRIAEANDRKLSQEIRRAIRLYIAQAEQDAAA